MANGNAIDFSSVGGKPVTPPAAGGGIDFSSVGGVPAGQQPTGPQATEKANLFVPGVGYTQMDVPQGMAKTYESAYMHGLRQGAGLAAVTGLAGGGMAVTPAATSAVGAALLPSAARAGQALNDVEDAIGDEPVDISKVGDVALEARDWWNAGGTRVKQISDFLRRATDPDAGDMTFSEARDFLSNASRRLSAEEAQKLAPQARRYLSQFASSLNNAIQDTADGTGLGDEYRSAIDEYRGAMKLNNAWETTKEMGAEMVKKAIQNAPWIGGAYAIAKKYMP